MRFRSLALALLSALSVPAFAADDVAEAPKVKWVLPWKAGTTLSYETEDLISQARDGKTSRVRTTSTTHVAIAQARKDGFLQTWKSENARVEMLEGDQAMGSMVDQMQASAKALERTTLEVQLDKDGMYAGLRNLDSVSKQLREAMAPMMLVASEAELAKIEDKAKREARRAELKQQMGGAMDRLFTPALIESMVTRYIQDYAGFHGLELEPDMAYEAETELPNPLGGANFPAKLQFSISVDEEDGEDLYVSYDLVMDPEKAAAAARDAASKIAGKDIGKDAIKSLEVGDEGLFVVNRATGVVEMFETTRTTKAEGMTKVERHRMRLLDDTHGHYWKDDEEAGEEG